MSAELKELLPLVEATKAELLEDLRKLVAIPSVEGTPEPGAPFGRAVEESLEGLLAIADRMGFETHNYDGYVGTIEWGSGEEMIGVLSHVDVVPAGDLSAWNTDPWVMTEKDGVLYGRGVIDDKGPVLSCLYGMYALKQTGFVPKKRIRFIIGTNEETGWGCIHYYKDHNMEPPTASFSPDGMYTVVNREKGIYVGTFEKQIDSAVTISAGEASNLVPANAKAVLPEKLFGDAAKAAAEKAGAAVTCENGCVAVACKGKNAPSHTPQNGQSAITPLLQILQASEDAALAAVCGSLLAVSSDIDGTGFGIACTDEPSGMLNSTLSLISLQDGVMKVTFDMRMPVTKDLRALAAKAGEKLTEVGFALTDETVKEPLYVPDDTDLIKTLCSVYEEVTGGKAILYSMGGGTYARAFPNCVCFGAVYPDEPVTVHSPNEQAFVEKLHRNTLMYGMALRALTE